MLDDIAAFFEITPMIAAAFRRQLTLDVSPTFHAAGYADDAADDYASFADFDDAAIFSALAYATAVAAFLSCCMIICLLCHCHIIELRHSH